MTSIYPLLRPLLFQLDPEQAHDLTLGLIRLAGNIPPVRSALRAYFRPPLKPVEAFGLHFANPVGLAAGYDKDGDGWRGLACLGFGHIEVGTVTPRPQPGNPRKRVFRLPQEKALINRMGFPGKGAAYMAAHLKGPRPAGLVLGVSLGKNKDTPLEEAVQDYTDLYTQFASLGDYLAINVSSPNTVGLRRLQAREALSDLLGALRDLRRQAEYKPPILVKLAPDLSDEELDDALEVTLETGMDGVIATNTTLRREGVPAWAKNEAGGLSGAPLRELSTEMVRKIVRRTGGKLPVVGVGGIEDPDSAREKLDAGAVLVQVYSGMVYEGPGLVKRIVSGL